MNDAVFQKFSKIPRFFRDIEITEKIDGTNAQVHILDNGQILAAGRNKYLTIEDDNYGFAKWVSENADMLLELGPGRHYGEWYGHRINRNYGLMTRKLALFNRDRWAGVLGSDRVVPQLYVGPFSENAVRDAMDRLLRHGSCAVPGFLNPEGIVIRHLASGHLYKFTAGSDGHKRDGEK